MQVETQTNMKSQVTGVRKSSEEVESPRKSSKRMKVTHSPLESSSNENANLDTCNGSGNGDQSDVVNDVSMVPEVNLNENELYNSQSYEAYTNGSMNNGKKSNCEEILNNDRFNEIPNITEDEHCLMSGEILNPTDVDMQSVVTDAHDSQHLPPPTLEQYNNCSNQASDIAIETPDFADKNSYESSTDVASSDGSFNSETQISSEVNPPCPMQNEPENFELGVSSKDIDLNNENVDFSTLTSEPISPSSDDLVECSAALSSEESASVLKKDDIRYLGIYDLKTSHLEGHADIIFSVAANDKVVLSASGDTTVKVWSVDEQAELNNFAGHSDAVTSIVLLNPLQTKSLAEKLDCQEITLIAVSASLDCHIKTWSVHDGKELISIYTYNSITCMGYLHPNVCVIGTEGGKLEIWDLIEKKKIDSTLAHDSSVSDLKVLDSHIYSTSIDGTVKVWLYEEEELLPLYSRKRRETSSNGTDMGPTLWKSVAVNEDILFLGDSTPYLKVLNWKLGRLRLLVNQKENVGECDALLAEENVLLSTSYNNKSDTGSINVWLLPDLTYVGTLSGNVQDIFCLALTRLENKLRIVSGGHQLIVWDFNLKEPSKTSPSAEFSFQEIDGLGIEIKETREKNIKIETSASSSNLNTSAEKQNRCNIL